MKIDMGKYVEIKWTRKGSKEEEGGVKEEDGRGKRQGDEERKRWGDKEEKIMKRGRDKESEIMKRYGRGRGVWGEE